MLKIISKYSLPLFILALCVIWLSWKWYHTPGKATGAIAPDFTTTQPNGETLRFSDFKGKIVLLDFWASWCGPCRKTNPSVVSLYRDFHNKKYKDAADFEVVSIGLEEDKNRWLNAIQQDGLVWPWHGSDLQMFNDHVASLYEVRAIPAQYLIDTDGKIIAVNPNPDFIKETLTRRIAL